MIAGKKIHSGFTVDYNLLPDDEEVLTTGDIARAMKTETRTIGRWIDKGIIKGYKTDNGSRKVNSEDFLKFIERYSIPETSQGEKEIGG